MSGDTTYQALKRLSWLPEREASDNGSVIAGQDYDNVFIAGGTLDNVTITNSNIQGEVTTTGSPASGNLTKFSGTSSITNGNLSGDITTSNTLATTLAIVNSNVGTFQGLTINAKGLVTAASNQSYLTANQTITASGDATGSGTTSLPLTLATVNSNVGSFTTANITVDAKGRITAASSGSGGGAPTPIIAAGNPTFNSVSGVTGQLYFDTSDNFAYIYNGGWEPLDIPLRPAGWSEYSNSGMVLSSSNTVVTIGTLFSSNAHNNTNCVIKGWPAKRNGLRYFEVVNNGTVPQFVGVTFAGQFVQSNIGMNSIPSTIAWNPATGLVTAVSLAGVTIGTVAATATTGQSCQVCVDLDNFYFYARVNGSAWNAGAGDPDTQAGGFYYGGGVTDDPLVPIIQMQNTATAEIATINLGTSSFANPAPSTARAWAD